MRRIPPGCAPDLARDALKRVLGGKTTVVAAEPMSIPTSISLLSILILAAATDNRAVPTCATLPAATVFVGCRSARNRSRRGFFQVTEIDLDGDHIEVFLIANSSVMLVRLTRGVHS
jgi:hypothetical protein